jgi:hypothetical protein
VAERYDQKAEDVKAWFRATQWASDSNVDSGMIAKVIQYLKLANMVETKANNDSRQKKCIHLRVD